MMTLLATLGNLFGQDMLVIFLIVLILFGAKKLPELARGLGQSLNEFKKARDDFEHEIKNGQGDVVPKEAANKQAFASAAPTTQTNQTLPYNAPLPAGQEPAVDARALQLQVEQLQAQLRAVQERKDEKTPVA